MSDCEKLRERLVDMRVNLNGLRSGASTKVILTLKELLSLVERKRICITSTTAGMNFALTLLLPYIKEGLSAEEAASLEHRARELDDLHGRMAPLVVEIRRLEERVNKEDP